MKKFSKSFNTETTIVQFYGADFTWYKVVEISENRLLIKVEGLEGHFQRRHVLQYSNTKSLSEENKLNNYRATGSSLFKYDPESHAYIHVYRNDRFNTLRALVSAYENNIQNGSN